MLFILALSTLSTALTARLASFFWYFFAGFSFLCCWWSTKFGQLCYLIFLFLRPTHFHPKPVFLSFSLPNKGWCSRYSLWVCLLFLFLSLIFLMCFCKTDGVFLNSCPLPLKCILANLPILTIFTMSLSPFLVLISQINSLKSWNLIAVYTAEAGMLSAHYAAVSLTLM